jgi:hypothetical protein
MMAWNCTLTLRSVLLLSLHSFTKEANDRRRRPSAPVNTRSRRNSILDGSDHSDVENAEHGNLSDGSNSVYRWLKEAV